MTLLTTGIDTLDAMSFGDVRDRNAGLEPGHVMLIRGEPGAGKTTLALQIASNICREHPQGKVLFVTVEETAAVMRARQESFGFRAADRIEYIDRQKVGELVASVLQRKHAEGDAKGPQRIAAAARLKTAVGAVNEMLDEVPREALPAELHVALGGVVTALRVLYGGADAFPLIAEVLGKFSELVRAKFRADAPKHSYPEAPAVLVIDSINTFMNLLVNSFPDAQPRLLFHEFCEHLREKGVGGGALAPVIVLTGEHHFHDIDVDKHLPESFFCDIEIALRTEPVRLSRNERIADKVTLGYELSALLETDARSAESRSFCRVLKARYSPNQSRRCAYDIEPGVGIRFFETYPGDGKLLLFAENEQQRATWSSFFKRDLIDAYPALRYEMFTMSDLQSVYESSRRLQHVPLKTDMLLCALDSYWVVGYRDYRLKQLVNERLLALVDEHLNPATNLPWVDRRTLRERSGPHVETSPRSDESRWVCATYPRFVNDALDYCMNRMGVTLFTTTLKSLEARGGEKTARAARLARRIDECARKVADDGPLLHTKYGRLCAFLFGKTFGEALDPIADRLDLFDTFLRPLPRSAIALFGQYNSDVLSSFQREDMHQIWAGEDHWLAVPYDANIGIFVVRVDLLERALSRARSAEGLSVFRRTRAFLLDRERQLLLSLERRVNAGGREGSDLALEACFDAAELEELAGAVASELERCETERSLTATIEPPSLEEALERRLSWETVLCLSAVARSPLGIETRDFDTLMAFFLELVCNCGGNLVVEPGYRFRAKAALFVPLVRALHYFDALFELTTSRHQTIHPNPSSAASPGVYGEWLFSRFWYSTLVDAITAVRTTTDGQREYVFAGQHERGPKPELEIVPMPSGSRVEGAKHYACWGEWNFALLAGSENVALACDLVSNLMGALKVVDRGLRGAGLPTVTEFYERFGEQPCVPQDVRPDLGLPKMTFSKLRDVYLEPVEPSSATTRSASSRARRKAGVFRQQIFDYRHCAREIYSVLMNVKQSADGDGARRNTSDEIVNGALDMIRRIEGLRDMYIFIGDSFQHEVLKTAREMEWQPLDERRRHPRVRVTMKCELMLARDEAKKYGLIEDLSRGGLRVRHNLPAELEIVSVMIGSVSRKVSVCRDEQRRPGYVRVKFKKPLSDAAFAELLKRAPRQAPSTSSE